MLLVWASTSNSEPFVFCCCKEWSIDAFLRKNPVDSFSVERSLKSRPIVSIESIESTIGVIQSIFINNLSWFYLDYLKVLELICEFSFENFFIAVSSFVLIQANWLMISQVSSKVSQTNWEWKSRKGVFSVYIAIWWPWFEIVRKPRIVLNFISLIEFSKSSCIVDSKINS